MIPRPGGYEGRKESMTARKFELFMCCQGNGTTLCNKAVYENHDYKTIGHISSAGNIKFYVKPGYIPRKDMECIQRAADHARNDFIDRLDTEIKHRPLVIYERMLDALSTSEYLDFQKTHKGDAIVRKISALLPLYLERS